ncbi:MAG: IclR family transcriptional regulator [Desulfotignum sp.]|nr:IclR family transcriptional regulator [Desulfotignum sp.]MCF8089493.1 IclR family transcriptional regulator [Desulfotignum sp.]
MTETQKILTPSKTGNRYKVKSLEKALLILELMIDKGRNLSITEICHDLGYGKGTVHRILGTLKNRNFVHQYPATKLYGLGPRTLSIGSPGRKENFLRKTMAPFLRELHEECGETVNAAVNEYNQIRYIFRLESEEMLRISTPAGTRFPVHCSATGKIFLSFLSNEDIRRLHGGKPQLKKMTDRSISEMSDLISAVEKIRKTHIAFDDEEALSGVFCVAAPVVDAKGECVASISISTPKNRISKEICRRFAKMITITAREISASLTMP